MALAQAWDRFLYVYKVMIKNITHFSLEMDPEELAKQTKDPSSRPKMGSMGVPTGSTSIKIKCVHMHLDCIFVSFCFPGTPILVPTFVFLAPKYSPTASARSISRSCEAYILKLPIPVQSFECICSG
jgi:hypothetical protein